MGRPPVERLALLDLIVRAPRVAARQVRLNERDLALRVGCSRATVAAMIRDLEHAGLIRRALFKGRRGLIVEVGTLSEVACDLSRLAGAG